MAEAAGALASLGVAANIFQFLDLAGRIARRWWKIYHESSRQMEDNSDFNTPANLVSGLRNSVGLLGSNTQKCEIGMDRVAQDCTTVAEKLLERLGQLEELERSGRKRDALKAAVVSLWKQDEVKALEQRLERFKSQLSLQLLVSVRSFISQSHTQRQKEEALKAQDTQYATAEERDMLQALRETISQPWVTTPGPLILRHVCSKVPPSEFDRALHGLRPHILEAIAAGEQGVGSVYRLSEPSRDEPHHGINKSVQAKLQDWALQALDSDVLNDRQIQVSAAHTRTFRWIFEPSSVDGGPWFNFPNWLQDIHDPLYWVTGKPGSGKSTLMKFIQTFGEDTESLHGTQVEAMLPRQDGEPPWTIANYYAWYAGQELQKSIGGLCHSLIYQLAKCHPSTLPVLFPTCWEALWLVDDLGPQQLAIVKGLRGDERKALLDLVR